MQNELMQVQDAPPQFIESTAHLAEVLDSRSKLTPQDRIKQNEELVRVLAPVVQREHLQNVQGKEYMCVGGGMAIANGMGFSISVSEVTFDKDLGVYSAVARMTDGVVESSAIGYVGDDEARWVRGPKYALMSMTQTRAIAKLCRANFGHLYTLLGAASATPAEEMSALPQQNTGTSLPRREDGGGAASSSLGGEERLSGDVQKIPVACVVVREGQSDRGPWAIYGITTDDGYQLETFRRPEHIDRAIETSSPLLFKGVEYNEKFKSYRFKFADPVATNKPTDTASPADEEMPW